MPQKKLFSCYFLRNLFLCTKGSESDYVILSLVRSLDESLIEKNPSKTWLDEHVGFIMDENQVNVALTRAKKGLVIIGI